MLRFGLLGAGRIGQIHGRNIATLAGRHAGRGRRRRPGRRGELAKATGAEVRDLKAIVAAEATSTRS